MYAKNYVLYRVLKYLSDILPDEVIDKWSEELKAIYASKTKFVVFVADDNVRADIVNRYIPCITEALHACFDSSLDLVLLPFEIDLREK